MLAQQKKILHVDDDARVAHVVATTLRAESYHVVTAHSAEEGLRKLRNERPDLVVLDLGMPGMSGLAMLRQIMTPEGKPQVPVIIFTAFAGMVDDKVRQQVSAVLMKPADIRVLSQEIERVLAERTPAPPAE